MNTHVAEVRVFRGVVGLLLLIPLVGGLVGAFGGLEGMAYLFGVDPPIEVAPLLRNNFRAVCLMFFAWVPLLLWSLAALPERAGAFRIAIACGFLAGFARLTGYLVDGYPGVVAMVFMTLELGFMPILLLWHARLVRLHTRPSADDGKLSLPPGQRIIGSFPRRFGVGFWEPLPPISQPPVIRVEGAVAQPLEVPVSRLVELPRKEIVADFHCVTGWTTPGLQWGGVSMRTFYESVIVPEARPDPGVTHVLLEGSDGERTTLVLEDALDDDVMLADQLGGTALEAGHGAPVRLLSPKQYGYKSTKYLCRIELHTRPPVARHRKIAVRILRWLVNPHPRARVAADERHRYLPAWSIRAIYRFFFRSWAWMYPERSRP